MILDQNKIASMIKARLLNGLYYFQIMFLLPFFSSLKTNPIKKLEKGVQHKQENPMGQM